MRPRRHSRLSWRRCFAQPERPWAPTRAAIGQIAPDPDALGRYEQHVLSCLQGRRLDGLRVALDCANGAAFQSAPAVFEAAGAELVAVLAIEPDGTNINDNVAPPTPAGWPEAVVAEGADLGLAFDGDADRVIAVDPAATSSTATAWSPCSRPICRAGSCSPARRSWSQ